MPPRWIPQFHLIQCLIAPLNYPTTFTATHSKWASKKHPKNWPIPFPFHTSHLYLCQVVLWDIQKFQVARHFKMLPIQWLSPAQGQETEMVSSLEFRQKFPRWFLLLVDTSSYTKIETEEGCVHLIKRYFVFQLLVVLSSIVYVRCFTQAEHKTKLPIGQHHIHLMMHMFKSKLRWLTKQENGLHFVLKPGISNICLGCKSFGTFCPPSLYRSGFGCVFWGLDRCSRNCWGVADKKKILP